MSNPADIMTGPPANANVHANSNSLASNLDSRVIQMVIATNVTLANAWKKFDLVRTNITNAVTSFPFFATSEFYTLGFAWEVSKLTANTSVANGGNYSAPPPPIDFWKLYWNTITGWAERAWNGVLAAGAFFAAVVRMSEDLAAFIDLRDRRSRPARDRSEHMVQIRDYDSSSSAL